MTAMSILLAILFIGLTLVAVQFAVLPTQEGGPSVVALTAQVAYGDGSPLYILFAAQHRADPVPGREHELQRLPAPGRDPRRGRLHAAPVLVPRRPARLLVGHRPAGGRRVRPALGLRRRHALADPALLGRRLRVLHAEPGRHGAALAHGAVDGLALAARDQRSRRHPDGGRPDRRGVGEVRRRRLPHRHPDPGARRDDAVHQPPVRASHGGSSPSARTSSSRRPTARSAWSWSRSRG